MSQRGKQEEMSPFWIDMSKLFELYVYSLLKDEYGKTILYQKQGTYGQPDFLEVDKRLIIDTKYKEYYKEDWSDLSQSEKDNIAKDIRQLSGYARDRNFAKNTNFSTGIKIIYLISTVIISSLQVENKTK